MSMEKEKIIEALKKISEKVSKIIPETVTGESLKNQLIGYCEGLIEGLEQND